MYFSAFASDSTNATWQLWYVCFPGEDDLENTKREMYQYKTV